MNLRILTLAAAAAFLGTTFAAERAQAQPAKREVCNTGSSGLNVRSAPSIHSRVGRTISEGTDMTMLGLSRNGQWVRASIDGRVGWVSRRYVCNDAGRGSGGSGNSGASAGSGETRWRNPVMGTCVTSDFGPRRRPCRGCSAYHRGCDLGAGCGTPIRAAAPGRVIFSGWKGGYGNTVMVQHAGGKVSLYAHMSRRDVRPGKVLAENTVLGKVGTTGSSTGCHLHFEVRQNGRAVDPQNFIGAGRCPRYGRSSGSRFLRP